METILIYIPMILFPKQGNQPHFTNIIKPTRLLTYEEYWGEFPCDIHVMGSPREGRGKLPGEEESHDEDPNVEADVVERSQEYEEEGGDDAAQHGQDHKLGWEDDGGEEGACESS